MHTPHIFSPLTAPPVDSTHAVLNEFQVKQILAITLFQQSLCQLEITFPNVLLLSLNPIYFTKKQLHLFLTSFYVTMFNLNSYACFLLTIIYIVSTFFTTIVFFFLLFWSRFTYVKNVVFVLPYVMPQKTPWAPIESRNVWYLYQNWPLSILLSLLYPQISYSRDYYIGVVLYIQSNAPTTNSMGPGKDFV